MAKGFEILHEDEPRGAKHGETREDSLNLLIIDGDPEYWVNENGDRVCAASSKNKKGFKWRRCKKTTIDSENGRCRLHGGQSPKGVASASYKGSGFSQYLPDALGDRMEEFMKDPNIASVRKHIALLDTRLAQKLEELDSAPSSEDWEELAETVDAIQQAFRAQEPDALAAGLNKLERQIEDGQETAEEWDDIFDVVEQRRKLAETETKRTKASANTLTVEEASMLVDVMVNMMQDVVESYDVPREALDDINNKTRKLLDS